MSITHRRVNPTTHLRFSHSTQAVILDEDEKVEKLVAAHDVSRGINPMSTLARAFGDARFS